MTPVDPATPMLVATGVRVAALAVGGAVVVLANVAAAIAIRDGIGLLRRRPVDPGDVEVGPTTVTGRVEAPATATAPLSREEAVCYWLREECLSFGVTDEEGELTVVAPFEVAGSDASVPIRLGEEADWNHPGLGEFRTLPRRAVESSHTERERFDTPGGRATILERVADRAPELGCEGTPRRYTEARIPEGERVHVTGRYDPERGAVVDDDATVVSDTSPVRTGLRRVAVGTLLAAGSLVGLYLVIRGAGAWFGVGPLA